MIVIVTGSREWRDRTSAWNPLERIRLKHATPDNPLVIRNGKARHGLDSIVSEWVERNQNNHVVEDPNPADWGRWGKQAGFRRNAAMVSKGADMGLAWAVPCMKRTPGARQVLTRRTEQPIASRECAMRAYRCTSLLKG